MSPKRKTSYFYRKNKTLYGLEAAGLRNVFAGDNPKVWRRARKPRIKEKEEQGT